MTPRRGVKESGYVRPEYLRAAAHLQRRNKPGTGRRGSPNSKWPMPALRHHLIQGLAYMEPRSKGRLAGFPPAHWFGSHLRLTLMFYQSQYKVLSPPYSEPYGFVSTDY